MVARSVHPTATPVRRGQGTWGPPRGGRLGGVGGLGQEGGEGEQEEDGEGAHGGIVQAGRASGNGKEGLPAGRAKGYDGALSVVQARGALIMGGLILWGQVAVCAL